MRFLSFLLTKKSWVTFSEERFESLLEQLGIQETS